MTRIAALTLTRNISADSRTPDASMAPTTRWFQADEQHVPAPPPGQRPGNAAPRRNGTTEQSQFTAPTTLSTQKNLRAINAARPDTAAWAKQILDPTGIADSGDASIISGETEHLANSSLSDTLLARHLFDPTGIADSDDDDNDAISSNASDYLDHSGTTGAPTPKNQTTLPPIKGAKATENSSVTTPKNSPGTAASSVLARLNARIAEVNGGNTRRRYS